MNTQSIIDILNSLDDKAGFKVSSVIVFLAIVGIVLAIFYVARHVLRRRQNDDREERLVFHKVVRKKKDKQKDEVAQKHSVIETPRALAEESEPQNDIPPRPVSIADKVRELQQNPLRLESTLIDDADAEMLKKYVEEAEPEAEPEAEIEVEDGELMDELKMLLEEVEEIDKTDNIDKEPSAPSILDPNTPVPYREESSPLFDELTGKIPAIVGDIKEQARKEFEASKQPPHPVKDDAAKPPRKDRMELSAATTGIALSAGEKFSF